MRMKNMTSTDKLELRAVMKFCVDLGKTPTQTMQLIEKSGRKCSRSLVFKWHSRFLDGRITIADDERSGRSPHLKSKMTKKVRDLINDDRRYTVRVLADELSNQGTLYTRYKLRRHRKCIALKGEYVEKC